MDFFGLFAVGTLFGVSLNFIPTRNTLHIDFKNSIIDWIPPAPNSLSLTDTFVRDVAVRRLNNEVIYSKRKVTYEITNICDGKIYFNQTNETELKNPSTKALTVNMEIGQKSSEQPPKLFDHDGTPINSITVKREQLTLHQYKVAVFPSETKRIVVKIQGKTELLPFKDIDVSIYPTHYSELFIEGEKKIMENLDIDVAPITWFDNWENANPTPTESKTTFGWRTTSDGLFPFQGGLLKIAVKGGLTSNATPCLTDKAQ